MDLCARLRARRAHGLYRQRRVVEGAQQRRLSVADQQPLNFAGNDYLGLANHAVVKQAFIKGVNQYGVGSGAAHLVTGHTRAHHELEAALAEFMGRPRALLFSTGYMANIGVLSALVGRHDVIYQDKHNHASLIDAGLLSRAKTRRYAHRDTADLRRRLDSKSGIIATDGVFSMTGNVAPLQALAEIAAQQRLMLLVDEAHGFGVLGKTGQGSAALAGLGTTPIIMATLGKALGTYGAFVAGDATVIESLIQFARSYVYTTAPPAAVACATLASLNIVINEPQRRAHLTENIRYFQQLARERRLPTPSTEKPKTPIQPIKCADVDHLMHIQQSLEAQGLLVGAMRPPTVPAPLLRVSLSSEHRRSDIEQLCAALQAANG